MTIRKALAVVELGRPWMRGHFGYLRSQLHHASSLPIFTAPASVLEDDETHLRGAASWIAAAQDSQRDGGISGRYKLASGWTSSYPETTGYLIPTLIKLAGTLADEGWRERAGRAIDFLLATQLPSGAFPAGEIAVNRSDPSPFNTAQILHGLNAWYSETRDERAERAANAAASWLQSVQDDDGAFRKYFYDNQVCTYSAHLSCWLAEHGRQHDDRAALAAASRHLEWVLRHHDPATGWFDRCGFDEEQHRARVAFTHTIAYTIFGVLLLGLLLEREDALTAARRSAERVLRRLELSNALPGVLDCGWKPVHRPQCVTGNAQMALVWLKLYELHGDLRYVNASLKALDHVKRAQDLGNANPGIRGGVPGSLPIWGDYISMAFPNWAAKYFVDALMAKQGVIGELAARINASPKPEATCESAS